MSVRPPSSRAGLGGDWGPASRAMANNCVLCSQELTKREVMDVSRLEVPIDLVRLLEGAGKSRCPMDAERDMGNMASGGWQSLLYQNCYVWGPPEACAAPCPVSGGDKQQVLQRRMCAGRSRCSQPSWGEGCPELEIIPGWCVP